MQPEEFEKLWLVDKSIIDDVAFSRAQDAVDTLFF